MRGRLKKKLDTFDYGLPKSETRIVRTIIKNASVSAFNTVQEQTDDTPCISASGDTICGRNDVVACPSYIPFGTIIDIAGKQYFCLDRMAGRFRDKEYFDISFDEDTKGARAFGRQIKDVIIYQ